MSYSQTRCECVSCGTCGGIGGIHDPFDYTGDGYERCEDCNGSGITEECYYCIDHREAYPDQYGY